MAESNPQAVIRDPQSLLCPQFENDLNLFWFSSKQEAKLQWAGLSVMPPFNLRLEEKQNRTEFLF